MKQNEKLLDEICKDLAQNTEEQEQKLVPHSIDPAVMVLEKYADRYPIWHHSGQAGGAPTKCTAEITQDICTLLQTGAHIDVVCEAVGIDRTSYYQWLRNADRDEKQGKYPGWTQAPDQSVYLAFAHNVKRAFHFAEVKLLSKLGNAEGDKTWMRLAWILERTRNDRYGQRQQVDVTHTVTAKIESAPLPPNTLEEFIDRARLQSRASIELQAQAVDAEYSDTNTCDSDSDNEPNTLSE